MSTIKDKLLEYSMSQNIMSSKLLSLMTVLFLTLIVIMPTNSVATDNSEFDELFVEIDTQTGQLFENYINMSGQSSIPASELIWSISNIIPFNTLSIAESSIVSSSTFTDVYVYDNVYHWNLSIPVDDLNCTCKFSIAAPNYAAVEEDSVVIFAGRNNHFSVINYLPSFQNLEDVDSELLLYEVIVPGTNDFMIADIDNIMFKAEICQYGGISCVSETKQVVLNHSIQSDGTFVVEINQQFLELDDGNWYFEIYLRDSYLRLSNVDQKVLTFDTMPPQVEILGTNNATEMDLEVFAVNIDDGYDSSLVALTWTITEPSGIVRGLSADEFVSNSSVKVEFNQSGVWNISVLAMDSVGFFTKQYHEVLIENIAPEISLQVSTIESEDSGKIVATTSQSWYIDASMTQDTSNDVENLVFQWIVDDDIIHTGKNLTNANFVKSGNYDVILVVTDNDGLSTQSTIQIVIESESDETSDGVSIILVLFCVVLIGLSLILLVRFSKDENSFNLPKWGK